MINKCIDISDMASAEYLAIINDMHRFMNIRPKKERLFHRCKGNSILEPTVIEAYKHWDFSWSILNGDLKKDMRILDCGSGRGALQFYLSSLGMDVYSIDIKDNSSKLFTKLKSLGIKLSLPPDRVHRKLNRKYNCDVKFRQESVGKMSFDSNFFDRILCISVIEHISDDTLKKSLLEMERVLKPEGLLILTFDYHFETADDVIGFTEKDYFEKVAETFKKLKIAGNKPVFTFDNWPEYINKVNRLFNNKNPNTSFGVVFRK